MKFDPAIIEEFAKRLYTTANRIVVFCTIMGFLFGLFTGGIGVAAFSRAYVMTSISYIMFFLFVLITSLIGRAIGTEKAFRLKLEAQRALCDLAIERNTRHAEKSG